MPILLGRASAGAKQPGQSSFKNTGTSNYVAYMLIGSSVFTMVTFAFWHVAYWLRWEQEAGTLEALYLAPDAPHLGGGRDGAVQLRPLPLLGLRRLLDWVAWCWGSTHSRARSGWRCCSSGWADPAVRPDAAVRGADPEGEGGQCPGQPDAVGGQLLDGYLFPHRYLPTAAAAGCTALPTHLDDQRGALGTAGSGFFLRKPGTWTWRCCGYSC